MMRVLRVVVLVLLAGCSGFAQQQSETYSIELRGFEVRAPQSAEISEVVPAAVQAVIADPDICCSKYSSLVDAVQASNGSDLQKLAEKLSGRHVRPDGRPYVLRAEYLAPHRTDGTPGSSISTILTNLTSNHAVLMRWHSQLFVIYGAVYSQVIVSSSDESGIGGYSTNYTIEELRLIDPATGQKKAFDTATDDWNGVEELLAFYVEPSSS